MGHMMDVTSARVLKPRVAALIVVGGSATPEWGSLALPGLHQALFSLHARVDQMQVYGVSIPGSILHPQQKAFQAALSTAKRLGANVASQMGKPFDEAKYLGDIDGACPICHLDAITLNGKDGLDHCTTCGAWGKLMFETGKEGRGRLDLKGQPVTSVITMEGKRRHMAELNEIRSDLEANPGIWKREHEKFREMDRFLLKL